MTRRYQFGLIGHGISYSLSPKIFSILCGMRDIEGSFAIADFPASRLEHEIGTLRTWDGFSVTVPYKERIIPFLDQVSPEAETIGAVNSVRVRDGRMAGTNTDTVGFVESLESLDVSPGSILVLGHGGAARAVVWTLTRRFPQARISICGRDGNRVAAIKDTMNDMAGRAGTARFMTYDSLADADVYEMIINCTPVGGPADPDRSPLREGYRFSGCRICYDLNYIPAKTALLRHAERAGCSIMNGLPMLIRQAVESFAFWTESDLDGAALSLEILDVLSTDNQGEAS